MKTIKTISIVFILINVIAIIALFVGVGIVLYTIDKGPAPENDALLFDNYYIFRTNSTHCTIYEKNKYDAQKGFSADHNIYQGWIYKYSFDENSNFIAMRTILGYDLDSVSQEVENVLYLRNYGTKQYVVVEDTLKLYNCSTEEFLDFQSDEALAEYCKKHDINLSNWFYPAGNGFVEETQTPLAGDYYLKTWLFDYSSIMLGEKELIFGYISDIQIKEDSISFRLRQPLTEYTPEHIEANESLSQLSEKPIGKYKLDFLYYEDIYYDKVISININTGCITES